MATGIRPDGEIFASGASEGEVLDFPSVPRGWGVTVDGKDPDGTKVTDGTNGIPPMEWFNALQQRTDAAILWMLQNAWPDWEKGTWPKGATVVNGDTVWRAQKETAIEPTDTTGDWLALFPLANLDKRYLHAETEGNYLHVDKNLADVEDASASLSNIGGVPTTRKINGKALSADITLSAGDVGAVQQGGGTGMLTNKVYLGWTGTKLKLQVDTTDEGEIYTTYNCPFPVGFVMLLGNGADPNAYFPGTTWVNQSGSFGGRVLAIGTAPGTVGGANSVTLSADNLPGHSHQGGVSAPGAAYGQFKTGTDNTGTYTLNYTNGTFTDNTNGASVTNAPFSVQNEFVHFCCWMRTA